jgi:outer membrane protein TolC
MTPCIKMTRFRTWSIAAAAVLIAGCGTVRLQPLSDNDLISRSRSDREAASAEVEPLKVPLSLEEAIARGLKYNLDRRVRMMEEAIALNQLDLSTYDMLPKVLAQAGYHWRNEDVITRSEDSVTGLPSLANPYISSDRTHTVTELGLTWNLLDFGLSYYSAKQQADRVLIAAERRRKAMHTLMQDIQTAFWRTASAQILRKDAQKGISAAEGALVDARKAEAERIRSPIDSLRYQRQVLENLRLLESIDQELSSAHVDLAALVNLPLSSAFEVAEPSDANLRDLLSIPIERMEELALTRNADLREQFYNARIASEETHKALLRLFPNLSFNYSLRHDTDRFLINKNWNEAGAQLSFNLMSLLSGPAQMKLADAGVKLADQRRVATQMAVVAQVHISRMQYANARRQFERAEALWRVDEKISKHIANRESAETQSKLERIANDTTAILSLLRRYQALALAHAAASKLQASMGMEPELGSVQDTTLAALTAAVAAWLKTSNMDAPMGAPRKI